MSALTGRLYIRKIAKLFYKHNFFNDDLCAKDETVYEILCDVYSSLDPVSKDRLHIEYDIVKSTEEYRAKKACPKSANVV